MLIQFIIKADKANEIEAQANAAIQSGANWIEICAPDSVDDDALKSVVENLRPALAEKGAVLILGNRYEQAKDWQTDGVHLYTADHPISAVRVAMEAWPIIGVNVANRAEAEAMRPFDIDYLFFTSDGSTDAFDTLRDIARYIADNDIETPLVAGGNITPDNTTAHAEAGAAAIATSDLGLLGLLLQKAGTHNPKNT